MSIRVPDELLSTNTVNVSGNATSAEAKEVISVQAPKITDPMDLDAIRINIDVPESGGVLHAAIPIRKPPKEEWIRVHPSPEYQIAVPLLEDKSEGFGGNFFLVVPAMREVLEDDAAPYQVYLYVNVFGVPALWPIKLPKHGREMTAAAQSSLNLARLAQSQWIRMR